MSGLSRMAFAEHRKLEIRASDMVIVSASAIPGNEKSVSRVINQLVRTGADVVYEALAEVHVSGHARQEELKLMHMLVRPKFFLPVHGEYRHLYHHARLAEALGMPEERIHIPEVGEMIELSPNSMTVAGTVPSGSTLIDGLGVGDVGAVVLFPGQPIRCVRGRTSFMRRWAEVHVSRGGSSAWMISRQEDQLTTGNSELMRMLERLEKDMVARRPWQRK